MEAKLQEGSVMEPKLQLIVTAEEFTHLRMAISFALSDNDGTSNPYLAGWRKLATEMDDYVANMTG